jgi:TolB-like protein/Flp pilus assembly protein TadD
MTLLAGTRLGPYEILSRLGSGGMGEVYRARDTRLGREVAVKVLPEKFAQDPERLRRFDGEARAASALSDPHIVTVFDVGDANGVHFFASELVEGSDLRSLMDGDALTIRKALDLAEQIASGLAAAHEKGIVHRDLKPENVLIAKSGLAKIADFGLAKLAESSAANVSQGPTSEGHQTSAGVVMGTVAYMSPEQVRGQLLDHRSDIFSFGAVLYEMLTGRMAFQRGTAAETMARIMRDEPEPLERVAPNVPAPVRLIVERCLAKEPAERYDGTHDLARDLASSRLHLRESGIGVLAAAGVTKARSWWLAALGGVAVVAAVGILAVLITRQRGPQTPGARIASQKQPPRIVVLPFDNLGSSEDAYFAAGITEEITSRLANVRRLGVISRTTATEYPRKGRTVKQIGSDLGVDWVLEGTIRCDRSAGGPGRVRITPQLIRVADDTHVWSERYDRTLADIFSLQSDVAAKTVEAIGINLAPAEKSSLETIPTRDLVAYDHYLKGLAAGDRTFERGDIEEAVGHFQEAVNRDPSFALALAQLSHHHLQMYWFFYDRSEERLEKGRAAAEAAARLAPDLPESHDALGFLYYWGSRDYARATEEFQAARRTRPNDGLATLGLAAVAKRLGRWEQSAALLSEAARLDPRNTSLLEELAISLTFSRRYREADDLWATRISASPSTGLPRADRIWLQVLWRGDVGRAKTLLAEAERVPDLRDDMSSLGQVAYRVSLADRDFAGALRRLDADSRKAYSSQGVLLPLDLLRSQIYGLTGRTDECRRSAEKARIFLEAEIGKRPDEPQLHGALGIALALLGRKEEAIRAARRGVELMPTSKDVPGGLMRIEDLAFVCALVGRQDEAIEQLGVLLSSSGSFVTPHLLRLDPRWDPLRKNPKFEALLAKNEARS